MATIKMLIVVALILFLIHQAIDLLAALGRQVLRWRELKQRCDVSPAEHDMTFMLRKIKQGDVVRRSL